MDISEIIIIPNQRTLLGKKSLTLHKDMLTFEKQDVILLQFKMFRNYRGLEGTCIDLYRKLCNSSYVLKEGSIP